MGGGRRLRGARGEAIGERGADRGRISGVLGSSGRASARRLDLEHLFGAGGRGHLEPEDAVGRSASLVLQESEAPEALRGVPRGEGGGKGSQAPSHPLQEDPM